MKSAGSGRRGRSRLLLLGVAVGLIGLVAAGCIPEDPPPSDGSGITTLGIYADPGLYPSFSPDVTDYAVRCTGDLVAITVDAPDADPISVDGHGSLTGHFVDYVQKTTGESFTITDEGAARTYHVRCLPTDFPYYTVTRSGATQAGYYLIAPFVFSGGFPTPSYATIFDDNGVPIWWSKPTATLFTELLPNGHLGWTKWNGGSPEELGLDGNVVQPIHVVSDHGSAFSMTGKQYDLHDLLRLDNGNYVFVINYSLPHQDLTVIDPSSDHSNPGPSDAPVLDHLLVEVTPAGDIVWSWDAAQHITAAETDPQWYSYIRGTLDQSLGSPNYDIYHWNSVEQTSNGYLLSFRHLDAILDINTSDGSIAWKLGGSTTPQSLTISDDPVFTGGSHFGGQHDARLLGDGTVTLYDDGSGLSRAPRGVRYEIDTGAHTAKMLEQVTDASVPQSPWGGSARRLADGNWVLGFGGTQSFSEVDGSGNPRFQLVYAPGAFVYRAIPIPLGTLTKDALRAGMDAQYP